MATQSNVDLCPFNTLALPGEAAHYQKITTVEQLTASPLLKENASSSAAAAIWY